MIEDMTTDRGETVASMAPMRIGEGSPHRGRLTDLAVELAARAAGFRSGLQPELRTALAGLVRSMNCYYSNLIEGHDTHPVDIERALQADFSRDRRQRELQLEAKAHVEVQGWIDGGGLAGRGATIEGVKETHRRFCAALPEELLWVEDPATRQRERVIPGELRTHDVKVGRHVPPSPGSLPRLLASFEQAFTGLGRTDAILSVASAHHRLLWIHPFADGNGRVARLVSHAALLEALDTAGVWSVARGLARTAAEYKRLLAACDLPRRNDVDGRGALSEEALAEFTGYFLTTCLDQVQFMEGLVRPDLLRARVLDWAREQASSGRLPERARVVLEALLHGGELARGEVAPLLASTDRHARRVVAALIEAGAVKAEGTRGPLRLALPATLAARWMPGLFPDRR